MIRKFLSLHFILRNLMLYFVLTLFVAATYFGSVFVIISSFAGIGLIHYVLIGFIFFVFIMFVHDYIEDRIRNWIDLLYFRTDLDYEKTLKDTSAAMALLTDMERLLKLTARIVARRMKLTGAVLFLLEEKKDRYEIKGLEGISKELYGTTMSSNYPIIEAMEEGKDFILRSNIEKKLSSKFLSDYDRKKYMDILGDFSKLRITLSIPILLQNKLIAFLGLGSKLSGESFTNEDINFLITLANQNAIFIGNAILLEREKEAAKRIAEAQTLEKYTSTLEKMNKELIGTREELVKMERFSTVTKLTVSLQHEINNPLTSVLAQTQGLILKIEKDNNLSLGFISEHLKSIERETKRIRELLRNLAHITEPVIKEYMPGVEMIDINASTKY